jgi:hypothetical protein
MVETYYSINTEHFHFLKFILEGYDNLAVLSSVPGQHGCVKIRCSDESLPGLIAVMTSLAPRIRRTTLR